MSRGELADVVSEDRTAKGLVEGDPVLDPRPHGLEHHPSIMNKVGHELFFVQKAPVSLLQLVGEIPVEEGDKRHDTGSQEIIRKFHVVLETGLVDGIIASSQRNDTRPGEGKAVGLCPGLLQEFNVLGGAMVRVASHVTRAAVCNLAGNLAKRVPYRRASTVCCGAAFDLVSATVSVIRYPRREHGALTLRWRTPRGNQQEALLLGQCL